MIATFPSVSMEYVWVAVTSTSDDEDILTTLPVDMAFLEGKESEPEEADWISSAWDEDATSPVARCLVGAPDGVVLDNGVYWVWVRVTGSVERPVRQAGRIKIT